MNADFIRIAYRRTIWAALQEMLSDMYINGDEPAKKQLICEEVPFSQKEVTQEALFEILDQLEQLQQDERLQMSQFELRRRDVRPVQAKQKEGAQEQGTPEGAGSGGAEPEQPGAPAPEQRGGGAPAPG